MGEPALDGASVAIDIPVAFGALQVVRDLIIDLVVVPMRVVVEAVPPLVGR